MDITEIKEWMADRLVDGEDGGYPLPPDRWVPRINWLIKEHDLMRNALDSLPDVVTTPVD